MEQITREKHFFSRGRLLEKLACSAAAAKSKCKDKGKETVEIAYSGQQRMNARGDKCGMQHDPEHRRESK